MAYCTQCGKPIDNTAMFCSGCGTPVTGTQSGNSSTRKQTYTGTITKCPHCGEVLKAFEAICPTCGYELRETKASGAVSEFTLKLAQAETDERRVTLIRNFPIPNTKEDIFEFMILASTNISGEPLKAVYDAWLTKIEQCFQKAKLSFSNDTDFSKIRFIYEQTHKQVKRETFSRNAKTAGNTVSDLLSFSLINAPIWLGIASFIWAIQIDAVGGNASMHELVGVLFLIISSAVLLKRSALFAEFVFAGLSGGLSLYLSNFLDNGSMLQLGGVIVLIITVVRFFRKLAKNDDKEIKEKGIYWISIAVFLVLFFIVFGVVRGGMPIFPTTIDNLSSDTLEWPTTELSRLIPQPESNSGDIYTIDDDELWISMTNISSSQYEAYVDECIAKGFTIESNRADNEYNAYNKSGCHLELSFYGYYDDNSDWSFTIRLYAPITDTFQWPDTDLSRVLTAPPSDQGEILDSDAQTLSVDVYNISDVQYTKYLEICISDGFIVDGEKGEFNYNAYTEDGYHLSLNYSVPHKLSISLEAPMEMGTIHWPSSAIANELPKPKSSIGRIDSEYEFSLSAYISATSPEDYAEYVDACMEKGFASDYYRGDNSFSGENSTRSHVSVDYEGFNIMRIYIYNFSY